MTATRTNGAVRELPHDLTAERNVLGAMLLHSDAVPEVAAIVSPRDFYLSPSRRSA